MIFKVDLQQEFHSDFHRDLQVVFLSKMRMRFRSESQSDAEKILLIAD
jgi:hypothetical protein